MNKNNRALAVLSVAAYAAVAYPNPRQPRGLFSVETEKVLGLAGRTPHAAKKVLSRLSVGREVHIWASGHQAWVKTGPCAWTRSI